MNKLTYTYTNVPKQLLFYICAFYLVLRSIMAVSYTHLDVYKRQDLVWLPGLYFPFVQVLLAYLHCLSAVFAASLPSAS